MSAAPRTRPRWGFHQLSPDAARHVVRRAGITSGDLVVDLGAGHGALTTALVDVGARVIAVELHADRIARLRHRFADDPVIVVGTDIRDVRLPRQPFCVVANPPWSLAELIRARLLRAPNLVRADLVLPRKMVHRWAVHSTRIEVGASLRAETFLPPAPLGGAVAVLHGRRYRRPL